MNETSVKPDPSTWVEATRNKARVLTSQIASMKEYVKDMGWEDSVFEKMSAQAYIQLEELYSEEMPLSHALDTSDLIFRLEGPAIAVGNPRASVIATQFTKVRTQVTNVVKAISGFDTKHTFKPEDIDLGVAAVVRGSLILGFTAVNPSVEDETQQIKLLKKEDDPIFRATRQAIREIGIITKYVGEDDFKEKVEHDIPDSKIRDAAIIAVEEFSPSPQSGVNSVSIGAKDISIDKLKPLTSENRKFLRRIIRRPVTNKNKQTFVGIVREIDLDAHRLELRQIKDYPNISLRIAFDKEKTKQAAKWLDRKLEVEGNVELSSEGEPHLMMLDTAKIK